MGRCKLDQPIIDRSPMIHYAEMGAQAGVIIEKNGCCEPFRPQQPYRRIPLWRNTGWCFSQWAILKTRLF